MHADDVVDRVLAFARANELEAEPGGLRAQLLELPG